MLVGLPSEVRAFRWPSKNSKKRAGDVGPLLRPPPSFCRLAVWTARTAASKRPSPSRHCSNAFLGNRDGRRPPAAPEWERSEKRREGRSPCKQQIIVIRFGVWSTRTTGEIPTEYHNELIHTHRWKLWQNRISFYFVLNKGKMD